MDIVYHVNEKQDRVIAVAKSNSIYPLHTNHALVDALVDGGYVRPNEIYVPQMMKAYATCVGDDVYDEAVGRSIARDKVLIKYYSRMKKCLDAYERGIKAMVGEGTTADVHFCDNKIKNATHRLDAFE